MFAFWFLVSVSCIEPWAEGNPQGDKGAQGGGAGCSALCYVSAIFPTLIGFPKGHWSKIRRNRCFQREGPPLTGCHAQVERVDAVDYKQNAATVHSKGCHPAIGSCAQADAFSRGRWVTVTWLRLLCPGEGMLLGKTARLRQCSSCLD